MYVHIRVIHLHTIIKGVFIVLVPLAILLYGTVTSICI